MTPDNVMGLPDKTKFNTIKDVLNKLRPVAGKPLKEMIDTAIACATALEISFENQKASLAKMDGDVA